MDQSEKDIFISQELRYYDLSNIFFETPINDSIFEELKEIFFSINNISQIYFDKDIDVESIEKVKYLLEISPTMNDSIIDKYILNVENLDSNKLFNINFQNDNWWVSYKYKNNDVLTLHFDEYKDVYSKISLIIKKCCKNEYSLIENVASLYDYCKSYILDEDKDYPIRDALKSNKCNSNMLVIIFHKLLFQLGIQSFIGESIIDNKTSYVVVAYIKDNKYNIDGIYLFDILSDYIGNDDVPEKDFRLLNYNYFCILLKNFSNTIFSDRLVGILKCFIHDLDYDLEKISYVSRKELNYIQDIFDRDFLSIHSIVEETKEIEEEKILKILYNVNDIAKHTKLRDNYLSRKDKLMNYNIDYNTDKD